MVQRFVLLVLFAMMSAGCGLLLDFDPPDFPDAGLSVFDASVDAGRHARDAGFDASSDSGAFDGSDSGRERDASPDAFTDADIDASRVEVDAFVPDPCSDETGLCIRFIDPDPVEPIIAFMSIMYWTEGGVTVDSGWTSGSCQGGLRYIDVATTDCHFHADPVPSGRNIYFYPVTASGPRCSATTCAGFHTAYSFWMDSVSVDSTPGVGPVSMELRPTPHGTIMAVKYTTP